jgi:hypothetical protein
MVLILAILTRNGITELLQALCANTKLLRNRLLDWIVREEDKGLESGIRVLFLVDAP